MFKTNRIDHGNKFPIVIEFFGLPGAGKTTIANYLSQKLRKHGCNVRTSDDFVQWLSRQKKIQKIGFVISSLGTAFLQLFWCVIFACGMRPFSAISLARILRVPYVNICFNRYLKTLDNQIVIMDQANVQLIWSIGAFSIQYKKKILRRVSKAVSQEKHNYVCLVLDAKNNSERIKNRPTQHSRFDHLSEAQLNLALPNASNIISDIREFIAGEGMSLTDINARNTCEINSDRIYSVISGKYDLSLFG